MTNIVQNLTIKSVDGVLGIRTQGGSMVGAHKSTGLWRHPNLRKSWACNNAFDALKFCPNVLNLLGLVIEIDPRHIFCLEYLFNLWIEPRVPTF